MTILRDPVRRYMSEYTHVKRGATWKGTRLQCDGRQASLEEVPFCFSGMQVRSKKAATMHLSYLLHNMCVI